MERAGGVILSTTVLAQRWRELRGARRARSSRSPCCPTWRRRNCSPNQASLLRSSPLRLVCASGSKAHKLAWQEELAPAIWPAPPRRASPVRLDLLGTMGLPDVLAPLPIASAASPTAAMPAMCRTRPRRSGPRGPGRRLFTDAKSAIRWMEFSLRGVASVLTPTATYREILQEAAMPSLPAGWPSGTPPSRSCCAIRSSARPSPSGPSQHALALFSPERADPISAPPPRSTRPAPLGRRKLLWCTCSSRPSPRVAPRGGAGPGPWPDRNGRKPLRHHRALCGPGSLAGPAEEEALGPGAGRGRGGREESREGLPADGQELEPEDLSPVPPGCSRLARCPVVRLALPRAAGACTIPPTWSASAAGFERERFDLIHAHCLQLITAGAAQGGGRAAHPLPDHPARRLVDQSPHQFLTTPLGSSVDPEDPAGLPSSPNGIDPRVREEALLRRQELDPILASAAGCLAVSESFADLHRRAGVPKVSCLENDWTPMGQVQRAARSPAHPCGSVMWEAWPATRGIRVAGRRAARQPLRARFTIIDGRLRRASRTTPPGETRPCGFSAVPMDRWPRSTTREQDVLVAPSIWPEVMASSPAKRSAPDSG